MLITHHNQFIHIIVMMMTIALRFIPTLLEETDKIMKSQQARGADFESGNIIQRIKALFPIFIPLFVSSFKRAFELADAMSCRCYVGGEGRTRLKIMKMTWRDAVAFIFTVAVCAGLVFLRFFKLQYCLHLHGGFLNGSFLGLTRDSVGGY